MSFTHDWWLRFPALAALDDPAWMELRNAARVLALPAGAVAFRAGDACENYLLVLDGSVRVQKLAENGREITLYRLEGGDACVLTTSCLLARERYPAEGVAETEVVAAVVPMATFLRALDQSPGFRRFVFTAYGERLSDLILLVEEVAFGRIDGRLAARLLELAGGADEVETTHQALAAELGTAREVVSRQLKDFERRGFVRLLRGRIQIVDGQSLKRYFDA
ncbi:MAG: Crp/Fnr family transcriptional regulator [Thiohalomonadaceae bacterium]